MLRLRFASHAEASRFLGLYSEALELKYDKRRALFRRPNFFSFDTDEGAVFLRCQGDECLSLEGGTREQFHRISRAIGWPPGPSGQPTPAREAKRVTAREDAAVPALTSLSIDSLPEPAGLEWGELSRAARRCPQQVYVARRRTRIVKSSVLDAPPECASSSLRQVVVNASGDCS